MTEEWVVLWAHCLFENMDYQKYCIHSDADDEEEEKAELERKFPLIADLYNDFGPERSWPKLGLFDPKWREWFEPRRHLFMADIKRPTEKDLQGNEEGFINLRIPLQSRLEDTVADVRDYLAPMYIATAHHPQPEPKYKLKTKRDGRVAIGYEEVRQAVLTATDADLFDAYMKGKQLTIKQAQIGFLSRKINELGWSMGVREKKKLIDHGYLDEDAYEGFKTRINRARKLFTLLSANAINASFPDDEKTQSTSWDYFKNMPTTPNTD